MPIGGQEYNKHEPSCLWPSCGPEVGFVGCGRNLQACWVLPISCVLEKALEAQIVSSHIFFFFFFANELNFYFLFIYFFVPQCSSQPCFEDKGQRRVSSKPSQQPAVCGPAFQSCTCRKPVASMEKIHDCPPPRGQALRRLGMFSS